MTRKSKKLLRKKSAKHSKLNNVRLGKKKTRQRKTWKKRRMRGGCIKVDGDLCANFEYPSIGNLTIFRRNIKTIPHTVSRMGIFASTFGMGSSYNRYDFYDKPWFFDNFPDAMELYYTIKSENLYNDRRLVFTTFPEIDNMRMEYIKDLLLKDPFEKNFLVYRITNGFVLSKVKKNKIGHAKVENVYLVEYTAPRGYASEILMVKISEMLNSKTLTTQFSIQEHIKGPTITNLIQTLLKGDIVKLKDDDNSTKNFLTVSSSESITAEIKQPSKSAPVPAPAPPPVPDTKFQELQSEADKFKIKYPDFLDFILSTKHTGFLKIYYNGLFIGKVQYDGENFSNSKGKGKNPDFEEFIKTMLEKKGIELLKIPN